MEKTLTYGEWLRRKRGTRGTPGFISQQDLGDRAGVLRTYINQIENGRVGTPEPPLRRRLHEALGTSEEELVRIGLISASQLADEAMRGVREIPAEYGPNAPPDSHNPFEKGTWHWVAMQRVRQMDDQQAEDVADYAEYILTRKKTELPVIVRGSSALGPPER